MSQPNILDLIKNTPVEWRPISEVTLRTSNIKWGKTTRSYQYIDLASVSIETKKIIEVSVIASKNAPSRAQKLVEKDDVIFATTRPTQMRYCLIDEKYNGEVASTGYCVLRVKKEEVLPKWILHLISSSEFKAYLEENQSGSAYPSISDTKVKEYKVPIPYPDNPKKSLKTQTEIVRILDTFSELTSALTSELTSELSARKKQYNYYLDQLLGFEEGEAEWITLSELTKPTSNIRWRDTDEVYRYIDLASVDRENNSITETIEIDADSAPSRAQKLVKEDDIIFATTRPTQMRVCLIDEAHSEAVASTGYCVLRANRKKTLPKWIFYHMSSNKFKTYLEENQSGSAYPAISDTKVKEFQIPIPCSTNTEKSRAEQSRIIAILDKFDTLANSINEGLPREIELHKKQYEYYRDMLLSFPKPEEIATQ